MATFNQKPTEFNVLHCKSFLDQFETNVIVQNFNIELVSPECSLPLTFWQKYYIISFLPLILIILIAAVYFTKRWKYHVQPVGFDEHLKVIFAKTLSLVLSLYVLLMGNAMTPFHCVGSASGSTFVLASSPSEQCFAEGTKWKNNLGFFVFGVFVYGLFIPGLTLFILFRNKKNLYKSYFQKHLRFLIQGYRKRYYFWEIVVIMKRMLFVFVSTLTSISVVSFNLKFVASIAIVTFFTFIEVMTLPYANHSRNSRALTYELLPMMCSNYLTRDLDGALFRF
jgi:hypothetical protein